MFTNLICPISNEKIDSNVSRISNILSVALVCVFIFTRQAIPLYFVTVDYAIRAFFNIKYSPLRLIAATLANVFGFKPKMIDKAPKVFASRLGFLCLLASAILFNAGMTVAAIGVAGMVSSLFTLDALGIVCIGCVIYHNLVFPFFEKKNWA